MRGRRGRGQSADRMTVPLGRAIHSSAFHNPKLHHLLRFSFFLSFFPFFSLSFPAPSYYRFFLLILLIVSLALSLLFFSFLLAPRMKEKKKLKSFFFLLPLNRMKGKSPSVLHNIPIWNRPAFHSDQSGEPTLENEYRLDFNGFLPGFTGFYRVLPSFICLY